MAQLLPRHSFIFLLFINEAVSFQTYYEIRLYLSALAKTTPFYALVGVLPTVGYKVWPPSITGYFNGKSRFNPIYNLLTNHDHLRHKQQNMRLALMLDESALRTGRFHILNQLDRKLDCQYL